MDKKSNMKKAMYEMFGVGGDGSEAASTAPAQVKSASVEVKSALGAEKKSVDHVEEAQKQINKILKDNNLVNDDLKGIEIDLNF